VHLPINLSFLEGKELTKDLNRSRDLMREKSSTEDLVDCVAGGGTQSFIIRHAIENNVGRDGTGIQQPSDKC